MSVIIHPAPPDPPSAETRAIMTLLRVVGYYLCLSEVGILPASIHDGMSGRGGYYWDSVSLGKTDLVAVWLKGESPLAGLEDVKLLDAYDLVLKALSADQIYQLWQRRANTFADILGNI